jgi:hypothetical protein
MQPLFFYGRRRVELKIQIPEYVKVAAALALIRLEYRPTSNYAELFENLSSIAKKRGHRVEESNNLLASKGCSGCIWPYFKVIIVQRRNIIKMVETLSHELGHMICFEAGALRKYDFDEDLADLVGEALLDILAQ